MLGGSGEKKTFRLAARYADHLNLIAPMSELRHKLDVLEQRCGEVGRDPSTLETSTLLTVVLDGHDTRRDVAEAVGGRVVRGTVEQVAEQIKTNVLDVGIDGVIVNLTTHGYDPGLITEVGEALTPLVWA
jgi:alkanesulfonate monooxygenase SsuD/methylene tetrahydromethanopterin reductase-like flavin-dependent oxidoreductase (luciferase family)